MTINRKIFLLFSTLFIILILFIYFALKDKENTALNFENSTIISKINNLNSLLTNELNKLNNLSYEYSKDEKIINFFKNKSSLQNIASNSNISYFLLLDINKELMYSEVFDVNSKEYLDLSDSLINFLKENNLDKFINNKKKIKFLNLDYEQSLFSIDYIDDLGYVFVARTLDSNFLLKLSNVLDSYISLLPSYKYENFKTHIFKYDINRDDEKFLYVNLEMYNENTKKNFYLLLKISRKYFFEITKSNEELLKLIFIFFVFFNLFIYLFINNIFTKRLSLISNTIKDISRKKDLVQKIELVYDDEITYLSKKLNEMFFVINESQNNNLKKERDFLQSVLDSQQHIIFITDGDTIESTNKKFLDIFKNNNSFYNNIALLDNKTKANLVSIAQKHSSIENPAKLKFENEDKYFIFDISKVEMQKYIICMNDVSSYNEKISDLKNKASKDELTACFNKNAIIDAATCWLDIKSYVLVVLDIDKFKLVNDTYGHYIGDCILRDLAILLKSHLSKDDLLGRFGGEEFIILLNASAQNIENITNRLRILIQEYKFYYENLQLKVTVSMGCTFCKKGSAFKDNFNVADKALYEAKNTGRNKVIIT